MATSLKEILENTKDIYMSNSSLEALLDYERVLDELDLYAFKNWKKGELVRGPKFEKYYISATFMWPKHAMPPQRRPDRHIRSQTASSAPSVERGRSAAVTSKRTTIMVTP